MTEQRNYRVTFILDTRNNEQAVEQLVASITEAVKGLGATVGNPRNLGRQEFIRVTDKKHTGDIFLVVDVSGSAAFNTQVQERFRLEKFVKRILVESV
jgi:ribosomal protein S6